MIPRSLGLAALLAVGACGNTTPGVPGDLKVAQFHWPDSAHRAAFAAGEQHVPMAITSSGTRSGALQFAKVSSSHPEVATFNITVPPAKSGAAELDAITGAPGDTELALLDGSDATVDKITIHVATPASIDLEKGWTDPGPSLVEGQSYTLHATAHDDKATPLDGWSLIEARFGGTLGEDQSLAQPDMPRHGFGFHAGDIGAGGIALSAGAATASVAVTIVGLADIDMVSISQDPQSPRSVHTVASAGGRPLYGHVCEWQLPSGVRLTSLSQGPSDLGGQPGENAYFASDDSNTFTAICVAGSAQASVVVTPK